MKLLLIEDDTRLTLALYSALNPYYKVEAVQTGKSALHEADINDFSVIVLDLNLPDMNGLSVCEQLRANGNHAPILVLSGEASIGSKVALLDSGADDYLTKPFNADELKARLRAIMRSKYNPDLHPSRLVAGDLVIDTLKHRVERGSKEVKLTGKEFSILECLMSNVGAVISRERLALSVWNEGWAGTGNTVDVHIKNLRDKVDRPYDVSLIKTVRGFGYKIDSSNVAPNQL